MFRYFRFKLEAFPDINLQIYFEKKNNWLSSVLVAHCKVVPFDTIQQFHKTGTETFEKWHFLFFDQLVSF